MPVRDKNATEGHIYGLFDPRHPLEPSYCRYVGQTINEVTQRLRDHIAEAQRSTSRRWVLRWIRKLLREEVVPVVQVLEFVQDSDPLVFAVLIDEAEQRWIAKGRIEGWRLTNHSGGGRGNRGYVFTPEQRKHQGDVARGRKHTEATKAKMSAASKGRPKSPEHRASLSTARKGMPNTEAQAEAAAKRRGIPLSQATKRKQSESIKNSPEMQRFWESRRGVPMPEDQKQKISESNTNNPKTIEASLIGGAEFKRKFESDPEFAAAWMEANQRASNEAKQRMLKKRVRCDECGFISNPQGIGHHQTSFNHSGKTPLPPE